MKKLFASTLAVICILVAGYAYLDYKSDNSLVANNTQKDKVAAATNQNNKTVTEISGQGDKPLETAVTDADFAFLYTSLDQLVKEADIIVEGQVTEVSYFDHNTTTFTKVMVKVTKTYNSSLKEGDVIPIIETGGITTKAALIRSNDNKFNEPIGEAEENTKVQVLFEGAPLTKVGESVLYFAKEDTEFFEPEKYYVSIGAFQGKFTVSNDSIERYVPRDMESSRYSSLRMSKADFAQKLVDAVRNKKK